ncbi:MAG: transcriptional repressor [Leptolyngbyaceae cyanobacterium T60_A2020_046]|nr:transcriptional repressor [Leptolyngbyaceae cyanobacterium T60_A2020_046]
MLSSQAIIDALKHRGLRVTPQRYAVYANLLARTDHPTVEQLLVDLNHDGPVSSQATVYNSLQALREVGLVREVLLEEGVSRYDANTAPHHHFRCRCCGHIEDIPWGTFANLRQAALRPGLTPDSFEVTVQGVCDRCTSAPTESTTP